MKDLKDMVPKLLLNVAVSIFPVSKRGRPLKHAPADIIAAIYAMITTGCSYRMTTMLATDIPPGTIFRHFNRLSSAGWFKTLNTCALHLADVAGIIDVSCFHIDSCSIRAVSGGTADYHYKERGKKGTKHHLVVDNGGLPLLSLITKASVHDVNVALLAIDQLPFKPQAVAADKAYDSSRLTALLECRAIANCVISRKLHNRDIKARISQKKRYVVERCFAHLNTQRGCRLRYDRHDNSFESRLLLDTSRIILNKTQKTACDYDINM